MNNPTIKSLKRYTTLPILIDYLEREKLVLLDPSKWEDKNDTLIIEEYKKKANIGKLFALCFTHKGETIHHWKAFANSSSGCCIEFDGPQLIKIFNNIPELKHGKVNYKRINDLTLSKIKLECIPFIKRIPYKTENEYRIICLAGSGNNFEIDVPISVVKRITFSQLLPEPIYKTIKSMLCDKYPITKRNIIRSTIYENQKWVRHFQE
ncbi:MAG: DUF2971 domain-containing protein [Candidatus Kapabacteria bacterium]|nr:DUF2971 domain-containing protein [Candidatus Kapabacteria bacterium]